MEEEQREKNLGSFVAALRREKGWTQKELAERLHVTDKAVSKWERRVSMPDTALLIPLAETLGVSVTELLRGERLESDAPLAQREVEMLVEGAVRLSAGEQQRRQEDWEWRYCFCALQIRRYSAACCWWKGCVWGLARICASGSGMCCRPIMMKTGSPVTATEYSV